MYSIFPCQRLRPKEAVRKLLKNHNLSIFPFENPACRPEESGGRDSHVWRFLLRLGLLSCKHKQARFYFISVRGLEVILIAMESGTFFVKIKDFFLLLTNLTLSGIIQTKVKIFQILALKRAALLYLRWSCSKSSRSTDLGVPPSPPESGCRWMSVSWVMLNLCHSSGKVAYFFHNSFRNWFIWPNRAAAMR